MLYSLTAHASVNIPQYLDNRQVYGYIAFGKKENEVERVRTLFQLHHIQSGRHPNRNGMDAGCTDRHQLIDVSPI